METENTDQALEKQTPQVGPGTYSPVTVHFQDSWGALMLGIAAELAASISVSHGWDLTVFSSGGLAIRPTLNGRF